MILNIKKGTFGDCIRNGDLIAVANIVEYFRKQPEFTDVKFYLMPDAIGSADYIQKFYQFLLENTDYFSISPGEKLLTWNKLNVWDFRDICGDLVKIKNSLVPEKKIVVFPVFDAPYNAWRNWPKEVFERILTEYDTEEYKDYEKIVCLSDKIQTSGNIGNWKVSQDFMSNIYHIMSAETYIGGDTGTSHFAWALDKPPKNLIYYSSSRGLVHTLPFYALEGRGKIKSYWLDFEGGWTPVSSKIQ